MHQHGSQRLQNRRELVINTATATATPPLQRPPDEIVEPARAVRDHWANRLRVAAPNDQAISVASPQPLRSADAADLEAESLGATKNKDPRPRPVHMTSNHEIQTGRTHNTVSGARLGGRDSNSTGEPRSGSRPTGNSPGQLAVDHNIASSTSGDSGNATSVTHAIQSTPATSTENEQTPQIPGEFQHAETGVGDRRPAVKKGLREKLRGLIGLGKKKKKH